jgi:hypothetical protein
MVLLLQRCLVFFFFISSAASVCAVLAMTMTTCITSPLAINAVVRSKGKPARGSWCEHSGDPAGSIAFAFDHVFDAGHVNGQDLSELNCSALPCNAVT